MRVLMVRANVLALYGIPIKEFPRLFFEVEKISDDINAKTICMFKREGGEHATLPTKHLAMGEKETKTLLKNIMCTFIRQKKQAT